MEYINLKAPFDKKILEKLNAGDYVKISGTILTARDAAHKLMFNALKNGEELPVTLNNEIIYYVGPCFGENGTVTAAGPTTSARMDLYTPSFYGCGIAATIGKGDRNDDVYNAIKRCGGVYFAAIGGAGALYAGAIKKVETLAYGFLGTEAVRKLTVVGFPVITAIDSKGNSIYKNREK